jgi:ureidoglycolate hydrolase
MTVASELRSLEAQELTNAAFAPFGQVVAASADGKPYDNDDAQLVLDRGTPRFYIMRLHQRGTRFHTITRHRQCTQCLGSLEGKDWLLGVAPPSASSLPDLDRIVAFRIPGTCFVKLHLGTWHAGPYFTEERIDFYNLELSDTNESDRETVNLKSQFGVEFAIA